MSRAVSAHAAPAEHASCELADIFRQYGEAYQRTHPMDCQNGQVHYTYRDRADGDRRKTDVLPAEEFLHRFLQHVLPDQFFRIRHYGLLANCVKGQRLPQCHRLLGARTPVIDEQPHTAAEWLLTLLGIDITRCPQCGGPLHGASLPRPRFSPSQTWQASDRDDFPPWDTS